MSRCVPRTDGHRHPHVVLRMAANQPDGLLHILRTLPQNLQAILVFANPLAGVTTALRHDEGLLSWTRPVKRERPSASPVHRPLMAFVDFCAIHRD